MQGFRLIPNWPRSTSCGPGLFPGGTLSRSVCRDDVQFPGGNLHPSMNLRFQGKGIPFCETVQKVMESVVWIEKASPQGIYEMVPRPRDCRAISFEWNATAAAFQSKPLGQSCFLSWPASGTRTKAFGPRRLSPALPNCPIQSLRHGSALFGQPFKGARLIVMADVGCERSRYSSDPFR